MTELPGAVMGPAFGQPFVERELTPENSAYGHGIGAAVRYLKEGRSVTRAGWNGAGMYLMLQRPDAHSKMTLPYVYMRTAQGDLVPWLCSQTDLLAQDWILL